VTLLAPDHLDQLHRTRCNSGKERFRRGELLAGTAVLHWAVDQKTVMPRTAEHASEDVGRCGRNGILSYICASHGSSLEVGALNVALLLQAR
jgi:hypothetical protein